MFPEWDAKLQDRFGGGGGSGCGTVCWTVSRARPDAGLWGAAVLRFFGRVGSVGLGGDTGVMVGRVGLLFWRFDDEMRAVQDD